MKTSTGTVWIGFLDPSRLTHPLVGHSSTAVYVVAISSRSHKKYVDQTDSSELDTLIVMAQQSDSQYSSLDYRDPAHVICLFVPVQHVRASREKEHC